jgi:hypothetical protein
MYKSKKQVFTLLDGASLLSQGSMYCRWWPKINGHNKWYLRKENQTFNCGKSIDDSGTPPNFTDSVILRNVGWQ